MGWGLPVHHLLALLHWKGLRTPLEKTNRIHAGLLRYKLIRNLLLSDEMRGVH